MSSSSSNSVGTREQAVAAQLAVIIETQFCNFFSICDSNFHFWTSTLGRRRQEELNFVRLAQ
jgi:hypothetical protein